MTDLYQTVIRVDRLFGDAYRADVGDLMNLQAAGILCRRTADQNDFVDTFGEVEVGEDFWEWTGKGLEILRHIEGMSGRRSRRRRRRT